jgi:sorbitol-specific phosphotransferase system component IIC
MDDKPKLVGIFYIVFGLLGLLGLPMIWIQKRAMAFVLETLAGTGQDAGQLIGMMQELMTLLVPAIIALIVVHILVNAAVGYCFIKRKLYATCFAASVMTYLLFPLGTLIGVFAIIVLTEEQTKKQFKPSK